MKPWRTTVFAAATVILWTFAAAAVEGTYAAIQKEAVARAKVPIDKCWAASLDKRSNPANPIIRDGTLAQSRRWKWRTEMKPWRTTVFAAATVILWTFAAAAVEGTYAAIQKEAVARAKVPIDKCWAASLDKRSNPAFVDRHFGSGHRPYMARRRAGGKAGAIATIRAHAPTLTLPSAGRSHQRRSGGTAMSTGASLAQSRRWKWRTEMKPWRTTVFAAATVILWTFAAAAVEGTYAAIQKEAVARAKVPIDKCWAASLDKRSNPANPIIRDGMLDTVLCLEGVIEDQFKPYYDTQITASEVKKRLKELRFGAGRLYWYIYNENPGCMPSCGTMNYTSHLSELARILEHMIQQMFHQRVDYRF